MFFRSVSSGQRIIMNQMIPCSEFQELEARINELLPPRYVGCFEATPPSSMGSAALLYDVNGKVKWGEIWTTFCHLALAGGPPHRGRFLGAVAAEEVQAAPQQYEAVALELKRALQLCVELPLRSDSEPGWIGLECDSEATAGWLVRAIIAENVMARHENAVLYVPAGPHFRIEKEMKNVVVCVAKSCHYFFDHLDPEKQMRVQAASLLRPPLPHEIQAQRDQYEQKMAMLTKQIAEKTGLQTRRSESPGWLGVDCGTEDNAVWMLRAVAVDDILVRREEAMLYVPVDLRSDGDAIGAVSDSVSKALRLSRLRAK